MAETTASFPRIKLVSFQRSDIDRLVGWIPSEAFLLQWAGPIFSFPLTRRQLENHLKKTSAEKPTLLLFKAVDSDTGQVVGHGEIASIDYRNSSATLARILIGPSDLRGIGIGHKIVHNLLQIAFDILHLHRVDLLVFDFNQQAIRSYEKAGFVKEGLMRECRKLEDNYWNSCIMSILEHEWREKDAAPLNGK